MGKNLLDKSQLAEYLGTSKVTISRYITLGMPAAVTGGRGRAYKFDPTVCKAWLTDYRNKHSVGRPRDDVDGVNLGRRIQEAKLTKEMADAALKELELAERQGKLIPISDVTDKVAAEYTAIRARLLSLPPKIAPLVLIETDINAIREILDSEIRSILEELSQ